MDTRASTRPLTTQGAELRGATSAPKSASAAKALALDNGTPAKAALPNVHTMISRLVTAHEYTHNASKSLRTARARTSRVRAARARALPARAPTPPP